MKEPGFNRREFLQKATAGAAGLAAGAFDVERAHATEAEYNLEQWFRLNVKINTLIVNGYRLTERVGGNHQYSKWEQYENSEHYFSPRENFTVEEMDQARAQALAELGQDDILEYIVAAFKTKKLPEAYRALYELDLHGLLTAFLAERGLYGQTSILYDGQYWGNDRIWDAHFASRATDFLPTGNQILNEEIDPRLWYVGNTEAMTEDVQDMPSWSQPKRQELFRTVLDHPKIRSLLQSSDCSLVEAYSIIKMALLETGYQVTERLPRVVVDLLGARQLFLKTSFLSYRTESYIAINHQASSPEEENDPYCDPSWTRELASICSVANNLQQYFDGESSIDLIQQAMAKSKGETCLFIDAHGRVNGDIRIRSGKDGVLTAAHLAGAWLERLHQAKDTTTLGAVHILLASCSSADYAFRLRQAFMQAYHDRPLKKNGKLVPIKDIVLPTIVAMSSLGSVTYAAAFFESYRRHYASIDTVKGLSGSYLMRKMQPIAYQISDMSFFIDTHGQAPYMMGQADVEKPTPVRYADV